MKLFSYLLSAGLAIAFTTASWADDPAKPAIPAKPPEAAKPEAKKGKGKRVAKGEKAKGAKKDRIKPSRPVLVQSLEKDVLVVKSAGRSKKATTEKKYTVNEATKIMVVEKGKKKAKGQKGKATAPATRDSLKQGTKIVVMAKGDIAESVTVMPTKAKAPRKAGKPKAKVTL